MSKRESCPACDGLGYQQKRCNQCRGQGCDHCSNGYITVNCGSCNGTGRKN